jgi:hypothetical protein
MRGASDEGSVGALLLPARDAPLNATEPIEGVTLKDGVEVTEAEAHAVA